MRRLQKPTRPAQPVAERQPRDGGETSSEATAGGAAGSAGQPGEGGEGGALESGDGASGGATPTGGASSAGAAGAVASAGTGGSAGGGACVPKKMCGFGPNAPDCYPPSDLSCGDVDDGCGGTIKPYITCGYGGYCSPSTQVCTPLTSDCVGQPGTSVCVAIDGARYYCSVAPKPEAPCKWSKNTSVYGCWLCTGDNL